MKYSFTFLLILCLSLDSLHAVEEVKNLNHQNCITKDIGAPPIYDCNGFFYNNEKERKDPLSTYECGGIFSSDERENTDTDPLEPLNRGIFYFNQGIDYILIEPIAGAYIELVPEYIRDRISNVLRNLNEPIVLINNLLQGELEDARGTVWRFLLNSTVGIIGIFDVSTDLGFPYKKEDLGLTFASWGIESGPYLVLPILGPSTIRDGWGRLGDYVVDPFNWLAYSVYSTSRSVVQILDVKTDNIQIIDNIKKNSIDYYASIRTWYTERRKGLMISQEDRQALDTPRPDEEESSNTSLLDEENN